MLKIQAWLPKHCSQIALNVWKTKTFVRKTIWRSLNRKSRSFLTNFSAKQTYSKSSGWLEWQVSAALWPNNLKMTSMSLSRKTVNCRCKRWSWWIKLRKSTINARRNSLRARLFTLQSREAWTKLPEQRQRVPKYFKALSRLSNRRRVESSLFTKKLKIQKEWPTVPWNWTSYNVNVERQN